MKKSTVIKGFFILSGIFVGLVVVLFLAFPFIYSWTENKNFAQLRKKSELNCEKMPLHCLVRNEELEKISQYSKNGRDLELKDNWGKTALFWAFDKEKYHIVDLLLDLKANPNTKDEKGISIFHQAVIREQFDTADKLLATGALIDDFNDINYPQTALHYCVMHNRLESVRYLLDHGARTDLDDSFGYTVLERINMHTHITREIQDLITLLSKTGFAYCSKPLVRA